MSRIRWYAVVYSSSHRLFLAQWVLGDVYLRRPHYLVIGSQAMSQTVEVREIICILKQKIITPAASLSDTPLPLTRSTDLRQKVVTHKDDY